MRSPVPVSVVRGGTVIKTTGDGVLTIIPSVTNTLQVRAGTADRARCRRTRSFASVSISATSTGKVTDRHRGGHRRSRPLHSPNQARARHKRSGRQHHGNKPAVRATRRAPTQGCARNLAALRNHITRAPSPPITAPRHRCDTRSAQKHRKIAPSTAIRTRQNEYLFVVKGLFRGCLGGRWAPSWGAIGSRLVSGPGVTRPKSRLSGCDAGHAGLWSRPWVSSRARSYLQGASHVGSEVPVDDVADATLPRVALLVGFCPRRLCGRSNRGRDCAVADLGDRGHVDRVVRVRFPRRGDGGRCVPPRRTRSAQCRCTRRSDARCRSGADRRCNR